MTQIPNLRGTLAGLQWCISTLTKPLSLSCQALSSSICQVTRKCFAYVACCPASHVLLNRSFHPVSQNRSVHMWHNRYEATACSVSQPCCVCFSTCFCWRFQASVCGKHCGYWMQSPQCTYHPCKVKINCYTLHHPACTLVPRQAGHSEGAHTLQQPIHSSSNPSGGDLNPES